MKSGGVPIWLFSRTSNLSIIPRPPPQPTLPPTQMYTHSGIPHSNAMETVTQCRSQAWRSSLSFAVEQRLVNVWLLLQLPYQCSLLVSAMKQHWAQLLSHSYHFFFSISHFYCGLLAVLLLLTTTHYDPVWVITKANIMANCKGESSMCCSS